MEDNNPIDIQEIIATFNENNDLYSREGEINEENYNPRGGELVDDELEIIYEINISEMFSIDVPPCNGTCQRGATNWGFAVDCLSKAKEKKRRR